MRFRRNFTSFVLNNVGSRVYIEQSNPFPKDGKQVNATNSSFLFSYVCVYLLETEMFVFVFFVLGLV